jgi:hypothetical protein
MTQTTKAYKINDNQNQNANQKQNPTDANPDARNEARNQDGQQKGGPLSHENPSIGANQPKVLPDERDQHMNKNDPKKNIPTDRSAK